MEEYRSLSHTKWQCKYHVVFIPKYRRRTLFGVLRRELGPVFRRLAEQKECRIEEGHILADHVHMLLSVPPKLAVSSVVGYLKGKNAIQVARHILKKERNYAGQHLWARGYFVDTVGQDPNASAATSRIERPRTDGLTNWSCPSSRTSKRTILN